MALKCKDVRACWKARATCQREDYPTRRFPISARFFGVARHLRGPDYARRRTVRAHLRSRCFQLAEIFREPSGSQQRTGKGNLSLRSYIHTNEGIVLQSERTYQSYREGLEAKIRRAEKRLEIFQKDVEEGYYATLNKVKIEEQETANRRSIELARSAAADSSYEDWKIGTVKFDLSEDFITKLDQWDRSDHSSRNGKKTPNKPEQPRLMNFAHL
jgi:hypothetical protein